MFKKYFERRGGGGVLVRVLLVKTIKILFFYSDSNECTASPSVMSVLNVAILVRLKAAGAKLQLVFQETEKLARVCEGVCQ